jgi:periplasmic divalent cation tolerance protein
LQQPNVLAPRQSPAAERLEFSNLPELLYLPGRFRASRHPAIVGGIVTDKVVILVTAANRDECKKIARHLVETRLAACVNISQPIESVYRWEGQIAEEGEFLLFIKSTSGLFPEIKTEISKIHSYHTPEILCLPVIDGSRDYLQWISDSVKPAGAVEGE